MKIRVTVIEDNSADVFLLEHALKTAGLNFDIQHFDDGAKARDYFRAPNLDPPHLLLLDLNLPCVDGIELLRVIRQQPSFDGIPVIVWSSSQSPMERAALAAFKAVRFIVKPSELDGFLQIGGMIREVLSAESK